jgi:hypothetical protein
MLQLLLGCNLVNLQGTQLTIWLWLVVVGRAHIVVAVAVAVDYWLLQLH